VIARSGREKAIRAMLAGVAAIAMAPATALAQEAPAAEPAPAAAPEAPIMGDIVVTAQKRAENIQDVPISIAAFSGATLAQANVTEVSNLGRLVPNFSATRGPQVAGVRLNIRGIGASGTSAVEPSVATFLDGIYVPRAGSLFGTMLDIDGVEVLRGPQGTLFGRNASVGAVSLRSAEPKFRDEARIGGEVGTGARYRLDGMVNVQVSEDVAIRAAALGEKFGGFWKYAPDGDRFGGNDTFSGRLSMKARLGDLTWVVRGDYTKLTGDGFPLILFDPDSLNATQLANFRNRLGGVLPETSFKDRSTNQNLNSDLDDQQYGFSSDLSLDFGEGWTARLLNGYRKWENHNDDGDNGFAPRRLLRRTSLFDSSSNSHELQILSPTDQLLGGRLNFVVGLYYFHEDFKIGEQFALLEDFCPLIVAPAVPALLPGCLANPGERATDLRFSQKLDSYAAYGQATAHLTDTLDFTLGGRFTRDDKTGRFVTTLNNPAGAVLRAPEAVDLEFGGSRFTWRAQVGWTPAEGKFLFASYSTGYKSGGFNSGGGAAPLNQRRVFGPETVKNWEVGAKTQWLDRMLTVNATAYRTDITGFQDRSFDGVSFLVRNAGSLRQQGVEVDTVLAPSRAIQLDFGVAYLDSEFLDFRGASGLPGFGGSQDLTGTRFTYSPEWSGTLGATYKGDLGLSGLRWTMRGTMSFTSEQNVGQVTDNNPQTFQGGYALLGLRVTLFGRDDRWSFAVFGDNLTNKGYCNQLYYQPLDSVFGLRNTTTGGTLVRCQVASPRTIGAGFNVNF
jgi:iron complex outermembrane receptor protein